LAGAHGFISQMPEGYDTLIQEQGASLSGGQRQRIAIARALVSNPRILIFDEATSALDTESEEVILQNLKNIAQGRTVLMIAHREKVLMRADRVVRL
jgi:subfamily B ATP-binding cassette protein HlyB/CyaB